MEFNAFEEEDPQYATIVIISISMIKTNSNSYPTLFATFM